MREERAVEFLNTSQSFSKLMKDAEEIQSKCSDHKVRGNDLRMEDLKLKFGKKSVPISDLAVGHLCGKLKVPSRYFNQLVDNGFNDLAADNINIWLEDNPKEFLLREYDGRIRGVLSGSYSVYDAPEILKTVAEVFDPDKFVLKGSYINEERLHLRFIQDEMMNIPEEDLYAGISLDSSDVGRSGLQVRFFVWKKVCTNGMMIAQSAAQLFRQKHIGINHEDFASGLTEGLERFYDLKDVVTDQIINTSKIPVKEDLEELLEDIKKATNLPDDSAEEVIEFMVKKYDRTQWGMINGITEVAQKYPLERRIELETIAGDLLAK